MQQLLIWLGRLRRFLWLGSLVVIIGLALLLTLARQLLPYASEYKGEIEARMSQVFQRPVQIGSVDARLQDFYPTLVLRDVTIRDVDNKLTLFRFNEVYVGLSLVKSLRQKKVVFVNLGLKGSHIAVVRDKAGKFRLKGLNLNLANKNQNLQESLQRGLGWVFSQRSLELKNTDIRIDDEKLGRSIHLPSVNALFRSLGNRHQVNATIQLDPADGQQLTLAMDIHGNASELDALRGSVYLAASQLNAEAWLRDVNLKGAAVHEGQLDLKLWSKWQGLQLQSMDADVGLMNTHLALLDQKDPINVDQLNLLLSYQHQEQGWLVDVKKLNGVVDGETLIPGRIRIRKDGQPAYTLESSTLQLKTLAHIGLKLPWLSKAQKEQLQHLQPQGEIHGLYLVYRPQQKKSLQASFNVNQLGIQAYHKIPYLSGIAGTVWLDSSSGTFMVNSSDVRFHQVGIYRQPWNLVKMAGRLDWYLRGDGLHIVSQRLETDAPESRMQSRFHLIIPNNGAPPFMDLYSHFESDDISTAPRYYPVDKIKPDLLKWLDQAFVSGRVYNGRLVHYGRVKKGYFPFIHNRGRFEVSFRTDKARVNFDPKWPAILQMDAQVNFVANSMHISTDSAMLYNGLRVRHMEANIADFKHPKLLIHADLKGTTQPTINFVMHSPLKESLGSALKHVEGRGDIVMNMDMQVPLTPGEHNTTSYQGQLDFIDNTLRVNFDDGYLEASRLNGRVHFTERDYQARNMSAMVLDHPAHFDINTYFQGNKSSVVISGKGIMDTKTLARQTRVWIFDYLYGQTPYQFSAVINNENNIYQTSFVRLSSDTHGVHMGMPYPVYKRSYEKRQLNARWDVDNNLINVAWGDELQTSMSFAPEAKGGYLNRVALSIGAGVQHALPKGEAVVVNGDLDHFSIRDWSPVFNKEVNSPGQMDKVLPIKIQLQSLNVTDVDYQIDKGSKLGQDVNLSRVPPIQIEVQNLAYKRKNYGHLQLAVSTDSKGIRLSHLSLDNPVLNFRGEGVWTMGRSPETRMSMDIHSSNTGGLLKMFGYQATMKGGELNAKVNLGWNDDVYRFRAQDLKGDVDFKILQGALQEVDPGVAGVGKVMGLFSFQALPRRLALDFSDLFSSGFHFDDINGKFVIENGKAKTDGITINAPSARIAMSGNSDLIRRDYDYDVIIIPGDGSNLFMAGLLAGGLQTGFVVWAIERMVHVDKYTQLVYHLGGTWDKPIITNLGEVKAKHDTSE